MIFKEDMEEKYECDIPPSKALLEIFDVYARNSIKERKDFNFDDKYGICLMLNGVGCG